MSLAVWMGGACRELALLRYPQDQGSGLIYRKLREIAGYEDVRIDVIAGTSAGGLNGALMLSHLAYGMPFDRGVRDLWLKVGDLEGLTRAPKERVPQSLLYGDAGFFRKVRDGMNDLLTREPGEPVDYPVRLTLTTTRLNPRPDAVRPAIGSALPVGRAAAHFRFRWDPSRVVALSDLSRERAFVVDQLAYAARSSSSFPGAFEPATPYVDVTTPWVTDTEGLPVYACGVNSETGWPDAGRSGRVELIDGGVLDNIPIAWAVRAIAGAKAEHPVDRWLLYLQPVAPKPPTTDMTAPGDNRGVTRLLRLVQKTFTIKLDTESLLDDARELETVTNAARRRQIIATGGLLDRKPAQVVRAAEGRLTAYREIVGRAEGARLAHLLEDPAAVCEPDPLPLPSESYPLRELDQAGGSPTLFNLLRAGLPHLVLPDDVASLTGLKTNVRSVMPVVRASTMLLDWVRALEAAGAAVEPERRAHLYAMRFASEVVLAVRDRFVLRLADGQVSVDPVEIMRKATRALVQLMTPREGDPTMGADLQAWARLLASRSVHILGSNGPDLAADLPSEGWPDDPFEVLWAAMAAAAETIAGIKTKPYPYPSGYLSLKNAVKDSAVGPMKALMCVEVLLGPDRPDPLSEPTDINFAVISAANVSPLEPDIFGSFLPDERRSQDKLSGNQMMNFAAFLSARWRLTDWTWGRLDAAQSLVEIVARPDRLPDDLTVDQVEEWFTGGTCQAWRAFLSQRWTQRQANPDSRVNQEHIKRSFVDAMTERVQWEILAEELPMLEFLEGRPGGGDLPIAAPASGTLDEPASPKRVSELLPRLKRVGQESVGLLVRRRDLRRAILRIGLVAWRALQPSGEGTACVARVLFALLKPLIALPVLLGITAARAAFAAGVLTWFAISATSGRWFSAPAHVLVIVGVTLAAVMWAWQSRYHLPKRKVICWPARLLLLAVALIIGTAFIVCAVDWTGEFPINEGWKAVAFVGVLAMLATIVPLRWIPDRKHWKAKLVQLVLVGLVGGIIAAFVMFLCGIFLRGQLSQDERAWLSLLTVYGPLAAESLLLTTFFPEPPGVDDAAAL